MLVVINVDSVDSRVIRTLTLDLPLSGLGSYNSTIDLAPVYNYHIYLYIYLFIYMVRRTSSFSQASNYIKKAS